MKATFLAGCLLLVTKVIAGGYAGALDRVWLYYAYLIDGLNDKDKQTIGWKCRKWDDIAEKCKLHSKTGQEWWEQCVGKLPERRCTFSQFHNFVGGTVATDQLLADKDGNLLPLTATDFDPEMTAKNVYNHFMAKQGSLKDWPGYKAVYHGIDEYVDTIDRITKVVEKAAAEGKATTDETKKYFQRFAETTAQIKTARIGDHGPFLITKANDVLPKKGVTVETEKVGTGSNPMDPNDPWETVDWEKTAKGGGQRKVYPITDGGYD
ncbi:hypothetical protein TrVFT333_010270 [Trichoderma virens FT-333]|nr:hypothetical protein TrVFT333_010270 [Trichoderma virens FT-333]